MKIGLSTLLFGGFDRDIALHHTRQAGYDGVELCAIPGMGEHFHLGLDEFIYEGIIETLDEGDLLLESVGASGGGPSTDRFHGLMQAAALLEAEFITTGSGGEMDNPDSWDATLKLFKDAVPVCEETGVRLSVKPHVRAAVYNIATARRFMEELDTPYIGLNLDNTHLQRHGDDPIEAVRELNEWIFTARIRDYKSEDFGIGPVENQIPGKGIADVKGYWDALGEHTDLDIVTVEMVGAKDFELDEVVRVVTETIEVLRSY